MNERLIHGGNVYAAARELRRSPGSILDFSASINPLGPSPKATRALCEASALIHHYPDPDCVNLKRALGRRWNLSPDQFVVGNGATELIDLIPRALSIRSALIVGPTYGEYAQAVSRAGGRNNLVLAKKEEDYRPPLKLVTQTVTARRSARSAFDAVFVCHPNSPTGQPCALDDLNALFRATDRAGVWVILDESFVEYCHALTCVPQLPSFPRLIILRSFTKFYGLPGLRVGYSVSSRPIAALLKQFQPPWSVNAMAQVAAEAAMSDQGHARRCLAYVKKERERLIRQLSTISGLSVFSSSANFLLLELPRSSRTREFAAALRRQGMLIRDCSSVEGCTQRSFRIALRTKVENDRLVSSLGKLLRGVR
jgi:threonine-phosphate decarboxylase